MSRLGAVFVVGALSAGYAPAQTGRDAAARTVGAARTVIDAAFPPSWEHDKLLDRVESTMSSVRATPIAAFLAERWIALARRPETSATTWRKMRGFMDDPTLHGLAKIAIRGALAARSRDRGDDEAFEKLDPTADFVGHALAIGPFGDAGSSFHGVRYAPEYEPFDPSSVFSGRYGPVPWRAVSRRPRSTRIDLAPESEPGKEKGCHYGLIQVKSEGDRDGWVELYCSGSFEAWWNGSRIASVHRLVQRRPTTSFLPVALRAGWNRLLVKTTSANTATFSARFAGGTGNTLTGLAFEPATVARPAASGASRHGRAPFVTALDQALQWVAESDRHPLTLALAGNLAARAAAPDLGVELAREAMSKGAGDPSVRAACLGTWRIARHMPADLVRTRIRELLEVDEKVSAAHRTLFEERVDRLFADDQRERALGLLDERLAANPDEIPTLEHKLRLLERSRWPGEARRVLDRLLVLAPHHPPFVLRIARAEEQEGNPSAALARIERELGDRPGDRQLIARALALASRIGDRGSVLRHLEARHRDDEGAFRALREQAAVAADSGDYREAITVLAKLASRRPKDAALHKRLGDLEYEDGNTAAALGHYERSLSLRPEQHGLRSWTRRLAGVEEFVEFKPFQLDALAEVAAFQERAEDGAAPSTLVLDQMVIRVYPDGSQIEETHVLRRVNDRRGIEQHEQADQAGDADELLELRTIHPDGSWYAPHRVAGTFSMPRLEPGVFIEERYRSYKDSPGLQPIDFVRFFFRGLEQPYRMSRLVVLLPKDHGLGRFALRNFPEADVSVRESEGLEAWVFLKRDMPKIDREVSMPPLDRIAPWVTFGRDRSVPAFVRERRTWFEHMTLPYREIRNKAAELCAGVDDEREQARRIHAFVHELAPDPARRPGSPYPVSVLLKGEGPRFFLQLALLRAAGVAWTPALVHPVPPEMELGTEPFLDASSFYRVPAARVRPAGSAPFWIVQGTPRHYPFAVPPTVLAGGPAAGCPYLLLDGDAGSPGTLPGQPQSELADARVRATGRIVDGRAEIEAEITVPGEQGYALKEQMRSINRDRRRLVARQIAAAFFRGFTVVESLLPDLDVPGRPLRFRLELARDGFVERTADGSSLPPLLAPSSLTRQFGGRRERTHPLVFHAYRVTDWEITLRPGKLRFGALPSGLFLRQELFDYGLSYALEEDALRIRRVLIMRPGAIEPRRYREFLDACRRIDDAEGARIRL